MTDRDPQYKEMQHHDEIKKRVFRLIRENSTSPKEMAQVNFMLGIDFAEAVLRMLKGFNLTLDDVDVVSTHGQTIWLLSMPRGKQVKSALTMAEGSIMAKMLHKTIVNDFRVHEQAYGRQGAPLVTFLDGLVLHHPTKLRACQNIGGIGNVCFIPPDCDGGIDEIYDFNTGPGNVFINHAMRHFTNGEQKYGKDGQWGKKGKMYQEVVDEYIHNHWWYKQDIPKTTGREVFGRRGSKEDVFATLTRISAQAIVEHYHRFAPKNRDIDEIYMCGGGAHNPNITDFIQKSFPNTRLTWLDEGNVPGDAKEAISFGDLDGNGAIVGRPLLVPKRVETSEPCVVGKITPGDNFREMMTMGMKFGKGFKGMLPPVRDLKVEKGRTGKAVHDF
ncbi:MAG: hypothetical protein M1830_005129 [Pleopsidium flavum]|nr:MAG: hypothetical protein M1830_005129 [Pleopsidium flavum]